MTSIKGIVFIIIGLFVSITSYVLGKKGGTNLQIFVYVGIAFVAFGLVKMLIETAGKPKKEKRPEQRTNPASPSNQRVKYCPGCGAKMPAYAHFCFNCGMKV
ncbi:zinc ribbon domain-containing protein [Candidatus Woesearchaeota archaeon]|nr:zinc ribbon domain-containing protein [Candidatus Woesearchaeota archaeon]